MPRGENGNVRLDRYLELLDKTTYWLEGKTGVHRRSLDAICDGEGCTIVTAHLIRQGTWAMRKQCQGLWVDYPDLVPEELL